MQKGMIMEFQFLTAEIKNRIGRRRSDQKEILNLDWCLPALGLTADRAKPFDILRLA